MSITVTGWIGIIAGLIAGGFVGMIVGIHCSDKYWKKKVSRIYNHVREWYESQAPYEIYKEESKQDD